MFVYIVTLFLAWICWKLLRLVQRRRARYARWAHVPRLPEDHWLWGITNKIEDGDGFLKACIKFTEQKNIKWITARITFALCPIVPVHPDTLKAVLLATNVPKSRGWNSGYRMMLPWIGEGLLISNGEKWERNRRLLTPAFHFDILKPYVNLFNDVADTFLDKIKEVSKENACIDIYPMVSRATLDSMLRCTLSYEDTSIQNTGENKNHYVEAISNITNNLNKRLLNPVFFVDSIFYSTSSGKEYKRMCTEVHEFSAKIIETRYTSLKTDPSQLDKRHLDFLDILITAKDDIGNGLTRQEIQDEVDTFMFEGHDTTASAASWTMFCLAKYPDMQEKIRREVETVLDGRSRLSAEDLPRLQDTVCFIKEAMRMYTPVPGTERELNQTLTIDDVTLLAGDVIYINPHLVHHNPYVWDNPSEFRPERFLPENSDKRDPFSFLVFSAGQRNCIGQHFAMNELKVLITRLVSRFRISLDPEHEPKPRYEIVMRAVNGIYLRFQER